MKIENDLAILSSHDSVGVLDHISGNQELLLACCWASSRSCLVKDSSRIAVGIASLNCPGAMLWSRKGFGSISEREPSVGGAKPKVLDSRFRSTTCILVLLCKSFSGLSTSDAKPACCTVEVCWLLVLCSGLDSALEIDVKFEILKSKK